MAVNGETAFLGKNNMNTFAIVKNNVGEIIAIEAGKAENRIVYGTYEAINSIDAISQHVTKTGGGLKTKENMPDKTEHKQNKLHESSLRMVLLHIIHLIALVGVNFDRQIEVSGTYFKSTSTSWEFIINPVGILAVIISWIVCSIIGSILKRVTMTYNNSLR
ncbi:hypothetical protein [Pseudoalteromonas sp. T1lg22]|uniref:hypothetical protein n=1 Tax=Pseudoalteromonas sp. T1lg22 TaxID=2077096 RepID=UPI00131A19E6|nr:hypothetical protein [Pseudoalteromonas sp. T1lg22]